MDLLSKINEKARLNHRKFDIKIGIGLGDHRDVIEDSVENASDNEFAEVGIYSSAEELLTALSHGEIDGAVRGTLPANDVVSRLRSIFSIDYLLRMACVKLPLANRYLFAAPVGIDEGVNIEQKLELIRLGNDFINKLDIEPSIGILSSGRSEDRGRSVQIDDDLDNADKLVELANENNIQVINYGILIEEAVKNCNYIIMPNGVSGNLFFRTLYFIGGAGAIGAPVLNMKKIFIDTSRAKKSYVESIAFASALVE